MGYDRVELRIIGRLSNHNDARDRRDVLAWQDFTRRVQSLAREYPVVSDMMGGDYADAATEA
jgi:hypothetical protein